MYYGYLFGIGPTKKLFVVSRVFISTPAQNSFIPPPVPVDSTTGVGKDVVAPNSSATEDEKG